MLKFRQECGQMSEKLPSAHYLTVPLCADSVGAPEVRYGESLTAIHFVTNDGSWGRITFERFDSLKISRGEHSPFPQSSDKEESYSWVETISDSPWLRERYEYEKKHYGNSYNFGGMVEEMLTDFSHYVFSFHDQFVEVLAAGIWFESSSEFLGDSDPAADYPLRGLKHIEPSERFESSGITCQVRCSTISEEDRAMGARFCSQTILEVATELGGRVGTNWSLTLRIDEKNVARYSLRNYFGHEVCSFSELPPLSILRRTIDKWLEEVSLRRKEMGKT